MTGVVALRRVTEGTECLSRTRAHVWGAKLETFRTLRNAKLCQVGTEGLETFLVNRPHAREETAQTLRTLRTSAGGTP